MTQLIQFLTGNKPKDKKMKKVIQHQLLNDSILSKKEGSPSFLKEMRIAKAANSKK